MRQRIPLALHAVGCAALLLIAARAEAACREGQVCHCGDQVYGTVTLTGDLVDCGRAGLKLGSGAVLDCAGHEIRGASLEKSETGVRLDDVSDAEVRNCRIRGFRRGIRLRGGSGNRVLANTLEENEIGIEVAGVTAAGMAVGHRIEKNVVRRSRRNGIHIGSAEKTVLAANQVLESGKEGLHLDACQGCEVRENTVGGSRAPALYLKHSSGGRFHGNTIRDGLVQVRGDSAKNEFNENVLEGSAFVFQGYRGGPDGGEGDVVSLPHHNQVTGGSVEGRKLCFRFVGAHDNLVRGVVVKGCEAAQMEPFGDAGAPLDNRIEVVVADAAAAPSPDSAAPSEAPAAVAPEAPARPLAGLGESEQRRFIAGLTAFERVETAESGLGPVFNATSCAECHHEPGLGGASDRTVRLVAPAADASPGDIKRLGAAPPLRTRGLRTAECSVRGESAPAQTTLRRRVTPPLYGLGLIAMIPDQQLLQRADPDDRNGDGISGRVNLIEDDAGGPGRVGRFGWKAQDADLRTAAARALRDLLGITNPVVPEEGAANADAAFVGCDALPEPEDDGAHLAALIDFLEMLAPLEPAPARSQLVEHGEGLFRSLGCGSCHVEELTTGDAGLAPLRNRPVRLYSDLLLHELGPRLADGITQGGATGAEFRTAPLWGLGRRTAFLHDGRAPTLGAAIALHDGEGKAARDRYLALPRSERQALISFLESL